MIIDRVFRQPVWSLALIACLTASFMTAHAADASNDASKVNLKLKIHDADSGFQLEARKTIKKGVAGLDAIREIVKVEYKEYRGLGAFVTSLCGVKPKKGLIWALYLDGKRSTKGISSVKIGADTLVEWKTEKP